MATAEEVDTAPLIELAMAYDKEIYLPVINTSRWRSGFMLFHRYKPGESRMIKNKFGIAEPEHRIGTCITGDSLDLVCVPLVGFNDHCDRIGMGGGYYDRTFSRRTFRRRQLVGIAFECQRAEFEPAPHDVPMDAIVTEGSVVLREKASAF
jgi:5-formyltetrahydrofolate cyclo-ligase